MDATAWLNSAARLARPTDASDLLGAAAAMDALARRNRMEEETQRLLKVIFGDADVAPRTLRERDAVVPSACSSLPPSILVSSSSGIAGACNGFGGVTACSGSGGGSGLAFSKHGDEAATGYRWSNASSAGATGSLITTAARANNNASRPAHSASASVPASASTSATVSAAASAGVSASARVHALLASLQHLIVPSPSVLPAATANGSSSSHQISGFPLAATLPTPTAQAAAPPPAQHIIHNQQQQRLQRQEQEQQQQHQRQQEEQQQHQRQQHGSLITAHVPMFSSRTLAPMSLPGAPLARPLSHPGPTALPPPPHHLSASSLSFSTASLSSLPSAFPSAFPPHNISESVLSPSSSAAAAFAPAASAAALLPFAPGSNLNLHSHASALPPMITDAPVLSSTPQPMALNYFPPLSVSSAVRVLPCGMQCSSWPLAHARATCSCGAVHGGVCMWGLGGAGGRDGNGKQAAAQQGERAAGEGEEAVPGSSNGGAL
ncbi:unnamed protein product [Closterium sp. NIES-65]|nr:unnamed protein product [Closterium sp. NIES-65]